MTYLFVPTYNPFEEISGLLRNKFEWFYTAYDAIISVTVNRTSSEPPKFEFTLDGNTYTIIDWSFFSEYRTFVHSLMIAIFVFNTLLWTIKQVRVVLCLGDD